MKRLLLIISLMAALTCTAQDFVIPQIQPETPGKSRVYIELLGYGTNFFGLNKNVKVVVDLGQFQSVFKAYYLLDENGKEIKFNSMVHAMNYMGERGWKFVQAYAIGGGGKYVYHWLLYKDVKDKSEIYDGIKVKYTETDPKKNSRDEEDDKYNEIY